MPALLRSTYSEASFISSSIPHNSLQSTLGIGLYRRQISHNNTVEHDGVDVGPSATTCIVLGSLLVIVGMMCFLMSVVYFCNSTHYFANCPRYAAHKSEHAAASRDTALSDHERRQQTLNIVEKIPREAFVAWAARVVASSPGRVPTDPLW